MRHKLTQPRLSGAVILLSVAGFWGATLSFTKYALRHVGVNELLAFRFILAALVLVPFLPKVKRGSITLANTLSAVVLGGVLYGIFYWQSLGLITVTTAAVGFITGTNVVMVPLITLICFRKRISHRVWVGVISTVIGLGFVAGRGIISTVSGSGLVLISAFLIAVDIVAVEKIMGSVDALWLAFVEIVTCSALAVVFLFLGSGTGFGNFKEVTSLAVMVAVVVNGILGTAFALWAQNYYQAIVPSAQVAVIFSTEPIFAAAIAWLFFGGTVTLNVVFGGILVLAGVAIADEEAFGYLVSKFLPNVDRGSSR
ncbi:MAG: DMT family transporter [Acidimicrobiaceae bacterium]|nr:DMT family transporter [Acidimicrobiaceae bacterium]